MTDTLRKSPEYRFNFIGLVLSLFLFCFGCNDPLIMSKDASPYKVKDLPVPNKVRTWLKGGKQSRITSTIKSDAVKIEGLSRREKLYRAKAYIRANFSYDNWHNGSAFKNTADDLFQRRVLGGCSDFALVELVLYRALNIPARMVVTANVDWLLGYKRSPMSMTEGHCFVEVYLEDSWHLVDPVFGWLFDAYRPDFPCYPHGEYFCRRGRDFWDMGISEIGDFNRVLRDLASKYQGQYIMPSYPKVPLP